MTTLCLPRAAVFVSLLIVTASFPLRAAAPATTSAVGGKVYLAIEYFDPINFDRMRWAHMTGEELILATLKNSAVEQARFAGYTGEIVVLDEKSPAPAGAPVLRLTWAENAVTADITMTGKNKYLGVVDRRPLSFHPDFNRMQRAIDTAGVSMARRDAALRAQVQMDLFTALQYLVRYLNDSAVAN